jgi:hypothetical protein
MEVPPVLVTLRGFYPPIPIQNPYFLVLPPKPQT